MLMQLHTCKILHQTFAEELPGYLTAESVADHNIQEIIKQFLFKIRKLPLITKGLLEKQIWSPNRRQSKMLWITRTKAADNFNRAKNIHSFSIKI